MREIGSSACVVKPYTVTTHSEDFSGKLKNVLKREFSPEVPNVVWCTDITYKYTRNEFVYLSCIIDLFSRKTVSWELALLLKIKYVISAVHKAIHTNRGIQYTSVSYYDETEGIIKSYSSKANSWENACIESFHALIKRELLNRFDIQRL